MKALQIKILEDIMKKRITALLLSAMCVLSLAACSKGNKEVKTEGKITAGTYKGMEVQKSTAELTEEELQEYIKSACEAEQYTESKKEGTLAKDMKVKVDYVSTIDGKEYTGGTQTGAVITLKDDGFRVDGVIEALIGKKVGDVVEVDSKYADDYSDKTLAGKAVHFKVTIKSIEETIIPEYNDEFVKKYYSYLGYTTTKELSDYFKEELIVSNIFSEVWEGVVENFEVVSYDSEKLKELVDQAVEYQESMLYYYYQLDLAAYLQARNMTEKEFRAELEEDCKAQLKEEMVIYEIARLENITISDEEYNKEFAIIAGMYGYDSSEEFSSAYADPAYDREYFEYTMIGKRVQKIVADNAKVVPDKETTTNADDAKGEDATTAAKDEEETTK